MGKYPKPEKEFSSKAPKYHQHTILQGVLAQNKLDLLQTLETAFGEIKVFVNAMLHNNFSQNMNALEYVVKENKKEHCEYLLSFQKLRAFYDTKNKNKQNAVTENRIFRLLFTLFVFCKDDSIIDYVLEELKLSKIVVTNFLDHSY